VPSSGFVGVRRVTGRAQPAATFKAATTSAASSSATPGRCNYSVLVRRPQTVPVGAAVHEIGPFGNHGTVCKPTTPKRRSTAERLKEKLPKV